MNQEDKAAIAALLGRRQAALGTLDGGAPYISMVAFAAEADGRGVLLHLSGLAPHTGHIAADPRASLLVCEPELPETEDVQTLARLTLAGQIRPVLRKDASYRALRSRYLTALPASAPLFDFADFELYRLTVERARFIGGFARALTLTPEQIASQMPRMVSTDRHR